jgi:hypothetical protein
LVELREDMSFYDAPRVYDRDTEHRAGTRFSPMPTNPPDVGGFRCSSCSTAALRRSRTPRLRTVVDVTWGEARGDQTSVVPGTDVR